MTSATRDHRPRRAVDTLRGLPAPLAPRFRRPRPRSSTRDPAVWNVSSTSSSMSTERHCETSTGSGQSPRQPCSARSATQPGSPPSPSSLAGAAPAPSHSHRAKGTASLFDTAWTSAGTAPSTPCSTSRRSPRPATTPTPAPTSPARPPRARHKEKLDAPTSATSPTESSAECGRTNEPDDPTSQPPLDKEACGSPAENLGRFTTR